MAERELPSGVYRHYKGPLYLVLGYAHDANAEDLAQWSERDREHLMIGERMVVVYVGLELDQAHTGPRLAVRTAEDFFAMVHLSGGSVCDQFGSAAVDPAFPLGPRIWHCQCRNQRALADWSIVPRFQYVGATYEPDPIGDTRG